MVCRTEALHDSERWTGDATYPIVKCPSVCAAALCRGAHIASGLDDRMKKIMTLRRRELDALHTRSVYHFE